MDPFSLHRLFIDFVTFISKQVLIVTTFVVEASDSLRDLHNVASSSPELNSSISLVSLGKQKSCPYADDANNVIAADKKIASVFIVQINGSTRAQLAYLYRF